MKALLESPPETHQPARARWKANPIIYEINTWVWLNQLSGEYGCPITLANVPARELDRLASWQFDAVWLMGLWHRGPATRASALNYLHEYRQALPDINEADVPGSAFAICDYRVEEQLGGREGLAIFREQLREHGIKLILDFVPNHVAADHRWLFEHPEYFVCGTLADLAAQPHSFFSIGGAAGEPLVVARGRDPFFPAWIDTAQLNAFQPGLRRALIDTMIDIGNQCDGLRCDMAMLLTNDIFAETWNGHVGEALATDFWLEVIPAVREAHPQMLFLAEVYWDLEHEMQRQGFDYTYDKRMYDRLVHGDAVDIRAHLRADLTYLQSNIRFIENHDEPRAMESFGEDRQRSAAVLICTLPGATLLHQGQIEGRRINLPVQINRAPEESPHPMLERFYRRLLREVSHPLYHEGQWRTIHPEPIHPADYTHNNLLIYVWTDAPDARLVVVNLSKEWSRAIIRLDKWLPRENEIWLLYDVLSESYTKHNGTALRERGLPLETPPYGAHIFRFDQDSG